MKDHERFVATESIPILLTTSSKYRILLLHYCFHSIINLFDVTVWTKVSHGNDKADSQ